MGKMNNSYKILVVTPEGEIRLVTWETLAWMEGKGKGKSKVPALN
jgi:hypothetical protein